MYTVGGYFVIVLFMYLHRLAQRDDLQNCLTNRGNRSGGGTHPCLGRPRELEKCHAAILGSRMHEFYIRETILLILYAIGHRLSLRTVIIVYVNQGPIL